MLVGDVTNSGVGEGNQVSLQVQTALCTQCLEEERTEASMAVKSRACEGKGGIVGLGYFSIEVRGRSI